MDRMPGDRMAAISTKVLMAFSVVLSALLFGMAGRIAGQESEGHPLIEPGYIKSKTCLSCHPGKEEGRFVHSAINIGCEKCHQATSETQKTTITLLATDGDLCGKCHEAKQDAVLHAPYKGRQCLVCHNPHSSDFPGQTRAAANTLCMSCHGANQSNVRVNAEARTVSLLDGRTIALEAYEKAPKISDDHSQSGAAYMLSHPLRGKTRPDSDAALNCLTCHDAHSSQAGHLLRPTP